MFKAIAALIICVCSLSASNVYAGYSEDVATINKGMPKPVKSFNQRQIDCTHWSGEEPYDKERLKEINAAITKLKCNDLEKDEMKLQKKYQSRPDVVKSINKSKELVL